MSNSKIKVAAVSYLNTKPMLHGLEQSPILDQLEIILKNPGDCFKQMKAGEVDIALLPVATLPYLKNCEIISDFCIGAEGDVGTVCLFSDVPLEEVDTILLDYQSRTSVALTKVLIEHHWKKKVEFKDTKAGFIKDIKGKTAGLVIGDRCFALKKKKAYQYDLGEAWTELTSLPFTFAVWVSRRKLSSEFITQFNQAIDLGVKGIPALAQSLQKNFSDQDVLDYFTEKISYFLDSKKRMALNKFYQLQRLDFQPKYSDQFMAHLEQNG